ncbi:MAG TPA: type II toxin-antitoxin system Phd/YefM family antitoxin [Albitalea sp.]|nr:type II toxin-antitoxin system Phd/YefM family antitoxin [Albitalea sp.]
MPLETKDIVPITTARAKLTELADQVARTGEGKVLTRNGESYVALITASDFDDLTAFRHEQHLSVLRAVAEGLEDIAAERTYSRDEFRPQLHALRQRVRQQHGLPPLEVHEPEPAYSVAPVAKKAKRKRGG